ncbi:hypothetical protein Fcan01_09723 [Folsomia candida]|uniref:Amino acid transporter transmembrane domain-containing protein n=2 Tax=Folsomia candida TaxID=158441 RepID=A0A226EED6_FOLCA|nr:hypothetical protein Fcan01_09723 [Folsomia candida]
MPLISSPTHPSSAQYSAMTGLIYVFNVIVGTGALAIPGVVHSSGYLLSSLVLVALALVSYITVTFVIESMAISNAIILTSPPTPPSLPPDDADSLDPGETDEDDPLISTSINQQQILSRACFDISRTVEMGHMARLYFPKYGVVLFYTTLVVYLYGDLAIYITVVSKSLRDVTCSKNLTLNELNSTCTEFFSPKIDRFGAYRLFCILFILTIGPFAFLNISKTKYLQVATTLLRWTAFTTMITLAIQRITTTSPPISPEISNIRQLPTLFGVSIYSFMCHHSLPSLVTPIRSKKSINLLFAMDYCLIATFYILLSVTGVFAFKEVQDLYTLNFIRDGDGGFINYLLALFPVFTLSTNFPIISITLKNNLRTLFDYESEFSNVIYTLLAIVPPFLVSVFVQDVQLLVNFTGSFAGAGIQYVIPSVILYQARRRVGLGSSNPYSSPFRGDGWIYGVLVWCGVSVGLVLVHMFG